MKKYSKKLFTPDYKELYEMHEATLVRIIHNPEMALMIAAEGIRAVTKKKESRK